LILLSVILKTIRNSFCAISSAVNSRISAKEYVFLIVKFVIKIVHLPSIIIVLTKFRTIKISHFLWLFWYTFSFMIILYISLSDILSQMIAVDMAHSKKIPCIWIAIFETIWHLVLDGLSVESTSLYLYSIWSHCLQKMLIEVVSLLILLHKHRLVSFR
jgi:hypothetical protein